MTETQARLMLERIQARLNELGEIMGACEITDKGSELRFAYIRGAYTAMHAARDITRQFVLYP